MSPASRMAIVGALLCLYPVRQCAAREAVAVQEHSSVLVEVVGVPDECLVGEVLDLTVVMRNKTDKPQEALAPEHVGLSWVRIAEDGRIRPLPRGEFVYEVDCDPSGMGVWGIYLAEVPPTPCVSSSPGLGHP